MAQLWFLMPDLPLTSLSICSFIPSTCRTWKKRIPSNPAVFKLGGRQILSGLCNYLRFIVVFISILGSHEFENIFKGSKYKKNWEALFINLILSIGTAWDFFPSFAWLHFPASSSFSRFRSFWTGITFSRLEELPMSRGRMSEGGAFSSSWESKDF